MEIRRRTLARLTFLIVVTCVLYGFYHGISGLRNTLSFSKKVPSKETLNSLSLGKDQCRNTFPEVTKEIDDAVARGPFKLEREPDDYQGLVQARIKGGKVRSPYNY